jgi:demethylmenaquinone methyltransferase/2-methoxy-6-polyprenyl-1,4-benzoquinol methylase
MLDIGKEKIKTKKLDQLIEMQLGDSEDLPFEDQMFDAVTVAFGVRNFENLQKGLREMNRVLKPGGIAAVLEFSKPKAFPVKQIYNFYFKYILPGFGKLVSKSKDAYTYLPESVSAFPEDKAFIDELRHAGFDKIIQKRLTMGIATLYSAHK